MNIQIEFYSDKSGTFKKGINLKWDTQEWRRFDELTPEEIEIVWDAVIRHPKAKAGLLHLSKSFPGNKKEILKQFINCNWTKLDNRLDINGRKLQFENVSCPMKSTGNCPYNGIGIICIRH
ncbi:MAG: hypothetical protein HQ521_13505 [Bacteroidetes bacterium]|nr:hypothetical protein [Bacteroidota bacterium]